MRRSVTRPEIRVGGHWLSGIFPYWGSLHHQTRENGDWQASWTAILKPGQRHPAIVHGAPVEVMLGPVRVFAGTLTEPNWDSGEMVAIGACREGENAPALTETGLATTKPNTAVDAAIARGVLPWTRVGNFGTTPVGEDDDQGGLYTVQSILDAWAEENLSGWRVDRDRRLIIDAPTETDPQWYVVPGSGELGQADDERVDRIFVRYVSTTSGRLATASYPASSVVGGVEQTMDVTDRGRMTSTKATNIARAEWEKLQGRSGWTNGLTLTNGQVTTKGGIPANLALIKAGDAVRLLGVRDPRGIASNLDVVIGDTDYDWEEDTVQINPRGMAARDEESVLEQAQQIAASASKQAAAAKSLASRNGRLLSGSVDVTVSASDNGSANISFPAGVFTTAPSVVGIASNSLYNVAVSSITTTAATITVRHINATVTTATPTVYWIAAQQ